VNARHRDWLNRHSSPHPLACFQQAIKLTGAINQIKHVTYMLETGWSPSPFPQFYEKAKANGWKTVTFDCGHDVMLDRPEELCSELLAISSAHPAATPGTP
jgi:hypothetical protein